FFCHWPRAQRPLHSFPTRRSSDLATTINMEMKIAAAHALAELAREDVPDEVAAAYGTRPKFGPDYIIPVPFDPRAAPRRSAAGRSEEHTSELQSRRDLVCRLLLEK